MFTLNSCRIANNMVGSPREACGARLINYVRQLAGGKQCQWGLSDGCYMCFSSGELMTSGVVDHQFV